MESEYAELIIPFTFIFIVALTLLCFSVGSWRRCRNRNRMAAEVPAWPTTSGRVRNWVALRNSMRRLSNYTLLVTYHYAVNGKVYTLDVTEAVVTFDRDAQSGAGDAAAKEEVAVLAENIRKEDKPAVIYYNPDDPSDSSTEIPRKQSCIPIALVVLFLAMFNLVSFLILMASLGAFVMVILGH